MRVGSLALIINWEIAQSLRLNYEVSRMVCTCAREARRIHHFLKNVEDWVIEYILREENIEANRLAKIAFNKEDGLQLFTDNLFDLD
ncbi:hypothetical protein Goshw_007299 [Gossypium schwendimanii]|uniref:RNase H type-1 domain-containing protein n=1 Tax=Gossypium schwendimanii TaxID=34291 RepID=A0A7J9NCQ2_GOSSC|nr:hypothetical protein [Gossypium schwendimanii]